MNESARNLMTKKNESFSLATASTVDSVLLQFSSSSRLDKMAKIAVFTVIALLVFLVAVNAAGDCPLPSKVLTCSPKCVDDTECSSLGRKCCRNICNSKSCLMPNQGGSSSSSGGYKGSSATGSYCGNVKCNSYEKCELDRTSKRMKCVRA